jgi:hypothetical protein
MRLALVTAALLFGLTLPAGAGTLFFSGNLRTDATVIDCGNLCTLQASDTDATWAQWAAVVDTFVVSTPSNMTALTFSYAGGTSGTGAIVAPGGLEPYLTLFDLTGDVLASTYTPVCPPGANTIGGQCLDVLLTGGVLAPGTYEIALTTWTNMSLAENLGSGTLADGFTGLGVLTDPETLNYAFDVVLDPTTAAPEPGSASLLLMAAGIGAAHLFHQRRKSK